LRLFETFSSFYEDMPYTNPGVSGLRYNAKNDAFLIADAFTLSCMLRYLRPGRIIEIGSGHSSCVTLDINDLFSKAGLIARLLSPIRTC
jgi:hypothetical protein